MRTALLAFAFASAASSGCSRKAPPTPTAAPAHAKFCEVEITGHVRLPKGSESAPAPMTFVAVGDCLAPSPKIIAFGGTTNGAFFVEAFAPWGSDLSLCAASEPAQGQPSSLYGKAAIPMHAEKGGEVEFKDVVIELAPGPPKTFPHNAGTR